MAENLRKLKQSFIRAAFIVEELRRVDLFRNNLDVAFKKTPDNSISVMTNILFEKNGGACKIEVTADDRAHIYEVKDERRPVLKCSCPLSMVVGEIVPKIEEDLFTQNQPKYPFNILYR